ncbi:unnamed protein product [Rhizoctonia solani]|uniref:BTB domain-containing protein n=1 Tax=Rhizoctonia solani TaxID=456999 RepID=A0A8H3BV83_9AGAM|nr:unnamed protein product [Rhizoctonia solani]
MLNIVRATWLPPGVNLTIPLLAMNPEQTYTILVQSQKFTLSHHQIKFDSPNYFTTCFLGDFYESQTRSVSLSRSPIMFPLIEQYLCGYMIFPLNERSIPEGMTTTQAIANLRADALFYQLEGLVRECDTYMRPVKKGLPASNRYLLVGWEVTKEDNEPVDFLNLDIKDIPKHLPTPKQLGWHLYVTRQELDNLGLKNMTMRDQFMNGGQEGLGALTGVMCVVNKIVPKDGRRRWVFGVCMDSYEGDKEGGEGGDQAEDEHEESEDEEGSEEAEENDGTNSEWEDEEDEDEEAHDYQWFDGGVIVVMLEE